MADLNNPVRVTRSQESKEHIIHPKRKAQSEHIMRQIVSNQQTVNVRLLSIEKATAESENTTIILKVAKDMTRIAGCQMWLDSQAKTYGVTIPEIAAKMSDGDVSEEIFSQFDYKIPENASRILNDSTYIAAGTSGTITIKPGIYDFCILYPNFSKYNGGFWFVDRSAWCRRDDYKFEQGFTYTFEISARGTIDFYPPSNLSAGELILPKDGKLTNKETIKLNIDNVGTMPAFDFKVIYQINDGKEISETFSGTIEGGQNSLYTFSTKADLSQPGLYTVKAGVKWDKDMNNANDFTTGDTKHPGASQLPFTEYFDNESTIRSRWNVIDANNDGLSWIWDFTSSQDGTQGSVRYPSNQQNQAADDYLISDPIFFTKGAMHITFDYSASYEEASETLDILYGKSPDPETMTLASHMEKLNNFSWKKGYVNLNINEEGNYYVAFHIRTPMGENNFGMTLDEISMDKGEYTGTPDLELSNLILPASSCDVQDTYYVNVTVGNKGNEPINAFTLHLQIDDEPVITQNYTDRIDPESQKVISIYSPSGKFSFSEKRKYIIRCWADCERDIIPENNQLESSLHNYEPIRTLPYDFLFDTEEATSDWYMPVPEPGYFDYGWQTYEAMVDSIPILSRCFYLEPGSYRINLKYKAGLKILDYELKENFIMMYGLSGTDPMKWNIFIDLKDQISTSFINHEARFEVAEAGEYSFAIMTTQWDKWNDMGMLSVKEVYLEKIPEHDLQLSQYYSPTLSAQVPEKQLKGPQTFLTSVTNRGTETEKNIKVEFRNDKKLVATSGSIHSLAYNKSQSLITKSNVPVWKKGDNIVLNATILADNNVKSKEYSYSFTVSDTVFAKEHCTKYEEGVGANSPISFGNVFSLATQDTLTSVSVGFAETIDELPFDLSVYRINKDNKITSTILKQSKIRPSQAGIKTYTLPVRLLEPGDYYFEIAQKNNQNILIVHDGQENGFFYATVNDSLVKINDSGNILVRANFGHKAKVLEYDIEIEKITRPIPEGVFKSDEPIKATIINNGSKIAENISIRCSVDGKELTPQNLARMEVYEQKEINFTADLSETGKHSIKVWADFEKDTNPANNSVEVYVVCKEQSSVYEMNFEECESFTDQNFVPAWISVDADKSPTAGIQGYSYPNQFKPMGFMVFDPFETTPSMENMENILPHSGRRFGASFSPASISRNDWLISPKVKLGNGSSIEFYMKSYVDTYGLEMCRVLVSETDNQITSFTIIADELMAQADDWEKVNIDLDRYDNKDVYVAIQCYTPSGFIFMIDDIRILTTSSIEKVPENQNPKVYPNPVKQGEKVNIESAGNPILSVSLYDAYGTLISNDELIATESCQVTTTALAGGMYFMRVHTQSGIKTFKFMIIN